MVSKKETIKWLIKNRTNEYGRIDLSHLNFGKPDILLNGIETKGKIYNIGQYAKEIHNFLQRAEKAIINADQESVLIKNNEQKANEIDNSKQQAKEIDNSSQEAKETIINKQQKTYEIKLG